MEALIEDEIDMDKGVADTVKDHKRNHDDDEDDDDEDPPAGPNQGKETKRRRTKELESSKKPSTTKETLKGQALSKGSKTGKSASIKEPVEEPIAEVVMDDASDYVVHEDDQPQDTFEPKIAKTLNPEWFTQPSRPPTSDPEWNKCQGERHKLWHRSQLNKFSKHNVYSTKKILEFYMFKEGEFVDLHLNDIEDMLLFAVQHKLFQLTDNDIVDFIMALRMFTRSLVIKKHVEDLQLSVESYQKKLYINPPQQTILEIEFKEPYTPSHKLPGDAPEVQDELHHRIHDFCLEYNKDVPRRKWADIEKRRSELIVELIDKQMRERRIIQNLERL
nr:hypothetical protein [Tanacetum cinerariifolium]